MIKDIKEIKGQKVKTWYIVRSEEKVIDYGYVAVGQEISTGQKYLDPFESEVAWEKRLLELGIKID